MAISKELLEIFDMDLIYDAELLESCTVCDLFLAGPSAMKRHLQRHKELGHKISDLHRVRAAVVPSSNSGPLRDSPGGAGEEDTPSGSAFGSNSDEDDNPHGCSSGSDDVRRTLVGPELTSLTSRIRKTIRKVDCNGTTPADDPMSCHPCNIVLGDYKSLADHMINGHMGRPSTKCRMCGLQFRQMRNLTAHQRICIDGLAGSKAGVSRSRSKEASSRAHTSASPASEKISCKRCGDTFDSHLRLQFHLAVPCEDVAKTPNPSSAPAVVTPFVRRAGLTKATLRATNAVEMHEHSFGEQSRVSTELKDDVPYNVASTNSNISNGSVNSATVDSCKTNSSNSSVLVSILRKPALSILRTSPVKGAPAEGSSPRDTTLEASPIYRTPMEVFGCVRDANTHDRSPSPLAADTSEQFPLLVPPERNPTFKDTKRILHTSFQLLEQQQQQRLRRQRQTPASRRVVYCEFCGRGFSTSHNLQWHRNLHLGLKPFKCGNCKATFASHPGLISHRKRCVSKAPCSPFVAKRPPNASEHTATGGSAIQPLASFKKTAPPTIIRRK